MHVPALTVAAAPQCSGPGNKLMTNGVKGTQHALCAVASQIWRHKTQGALFLRT